MKDFKGFEKPTENYSKLPHDFINLLPEIDTLAELKIILYLLRHTWGFSEFGKPKKLTTDEFCNGRKKRDQSRMDKGTGLSENSVRAGLEKAVEHGFILVETDESDKARIEKWYCLNMEGDAEIESRPANIESRPAKFAPLGAEFEERTEKETIERKKTLSQTELQEIQTLADRKMDYLIQKAKEYHEAEEAGKAWRGREFMVGSDYLEYADWYHKKTGWHMYGARAKEKIDTSAMAEFKAWWENDISLETLDMTYQVENDWRKVKSGIEQNITHPRELTAKAKAIQAAPPVVTNTNREEGKSSGYFA